ncbi:MAG: patatin-like phospholipase family protein [Chloroflexota bacterium]
MKIGLTLGGGGARGSAHIGVLMELERLKIQPELITGTSIGGMLGALLAFGLSIEEIRAFFTQLSVSSLFQLTTSTPSVTGNRKIEKLLETTLNGRPTFADLQIPLAIVTTDFVRRKEVVLDEGDVISAVLATIAIPLVFPPVEREGHTLVDGGVLNNTPFDVARARGATFVIAVDLSNTAPYGTPIPPDKEAKKMVDRMVLRTQQRKSWQVLSTLTDIITAQSFNARLAISRPDVLLQPNLGTIGLFDFHRMDEGIAVGQTAVREAEEQLTVISEQ